MHDSIFRGGVVFFISTLPSLAKGNGSEEFINPRRLNFLKQKPKAAGQECKACQRHLALDSLIRFC